MISYLTQLKASETPSPNQSRTLSILDTGMSIATLHPHLCQLPTIEEANIGSTQKLGNVYLL
jgi:hypothetical protein